MRGNLNYVTITHNSILTFLFLYIHSCYMQIKTPNNPRQIQEITTNHVSCKMFIKKVLYSTILYTHQVY